MQKNQGQLRAMRQKRRASTIRSLKQTIRELRDEEAIHQKQLTTQQRDIQYMNKTLVRMNNLLKHVYSHSLISSRGMKFLIIYYRMRDRLLPVESRRRKIFNQIITFFNFDRIAIKSPIGLKEDRHFKKMQSTMDREMLEQNIEYQKWIEYREPDAQRLAQQTQELFKKKILISIIVPVYETPEKFLQALVKSVMAQTYDQWQLCFAVSGEKQAKLVKLIHATSNQDKRIKIKVLKKNHGIGENSNHALSLATGDYITFLDHDDILPPFALYEVIKTIQAHPGIEFIYSDEDKITADGKTRFDPYFKPDFSPDTLRSNNYLCHLSVIKKSLMDKLKGFRQAFDGSQDYDLFLRAIDRTQKIIHIPKVLYHWRVHENSTAQNYRTKSYAMEAAQQALMDHLKRNKMKGKVSNGLLPTTYRVTHDISREPKVAIIIPNKDHADVLQTAIHSILEKTQYKNYSITIVDTGSTEKKTHQRYKQLIKEHANIRILEKKGEFNYSAVNNFAVSRSRGDLLLFLNNDVEVINSGWLSSMVEHAMRQDVGAVGAKLYYPDDTIQHGGVVLGILGIAGHAHKHFSREDPGYFFRLKMIQNVSAVTAACLMMRRDVFRDCKGFDEKYQLAFGDVDLCMKVRAFGKHVVWTPFAELYHHESKTRGYEDTPEKQLRFLGEQKFFKSKWGDALAQGDPYYSTNLTLLREDFSIKIQDEYENPYKLPFE